MQVQHTSEIYGAEYKAPPVTRASMRGIDSVDFVRRLAAKNRGIHSDILGRKGIWSPRQNEFMGLFWWSKHICGMDRGVMPEWPEWDWTEQLVRVPVEVAAREDIPLLSLDGITCPDYQMATCGFAMRPTQQKIVKVGWRDVMHRVVKANIPGLTRAWLSGEFSVDLSDTSARSPRPLRESMRA